MCLLDLAIDKFWGRLKSIKKNTKSIKFKRKKESLTFNLFERLWTHVDEKKTRYVHNFLDAWKIFLHKRNKLKQRTIFTKITSIYKVEDTIFLSMTGVETTVGRRLLFPRFLSCNFYAGSYSGVRKLSQYLNFIASE